MAKDTHRRCRAITDERSLNLSTSRLV
jgi:hypothetical protein